MKDTTKMQNFIFDLWCNKKKSFTQIADMDMPSDLSLERIRNIVYGGKTRLNTDHQRKIYSLFRMKFLELQDVNMAIQFVFNNQPSTRVSERHVRRIVNLKLKG